MPDLRKIWATFHEAHPGMHLRDAAVELGVTEADLLCLYAGDAVVHLQPQWQEIFIELKSWGKILIETRNDNGDLQDLATVDALETDLAQWHYGFAVEEETHTGEIQSLQFFDAAGHAIHKFTVTADPQRSLYQKLVATYRAAAQPDHLEISPALRKNPAAPHSRDTAEHVTPYSLKDFFRAMIDEKAQLTIEVKNAVGLQKKETVIARQQKRGPWLYLFFEGGFVRVRYTLFGAAWVTKPHRFEVYDKTGEFVFALDFLSNALLDRIPRQD